MNPASREFIHKVAPRYPEEDKYAGRQGTVAVYAVIDKSGIPQGLQIVSSAGSGLDKASLDAIRQWRHESKNKMVREMEKQFEPLLDTNQAAALANPPENPPKNGSPRSSSRSSGWQALALSRF
jgi:TonB family protein